METNTSEALFLVEGKFYLHIQECDEGYDFPLYRKNSFEEEDGGILATVEDMPVNEAAQEICELYDLDSERIQEMPVSMIEALQESAYEQMTEEINSQFWNGYVKTTTI